MRSNSPEGFLSVWLSKRSAYLHIQTAPYMEFSANEDGGAGYEVWIGCKL